MVGFYGIDRVNGTAEWGFYTCDPGRRGLGAPMAHAALQEAFGALGVRKLSAEVLDVSGEPIPGLFAAGRGTAGLAACGYASGISLGDGSFYGRRAGRAAANS